VPKINFHYFEEGSPGYEEDLEAVVRGVEFVQNMNKRVSEYIEEEVAPGPSVTTRKELEDFVRYQSWGHHASCTCQIGPEDEPMAVLDTDFRVYGTKNLRVVDASVFPRIPGLFIVSSVYMISEKASEVILTAADERDDVDRIVGLLKGKLVTDYQNAPIFLRDTHPKSNGLVQATFTVEPNLPEELRVGLFKEQSSYKSWIRFSNATPNVTPDTAKDFRGLSIKLFGVEGKKLLDDEKLTHDFLFIAHDTFSTGNPREFGDLFDFIINRGGPGGFFLRHIRNLINILVGFQRFGNQFEARWFSVAPYRFGNEEVKYRLFPTEDTKTPVPKNASPDYLLEVMKEQLLTRGTTMDFMVQFRTKPDKMPIENTLIPWKEKDSSFRKVATVTVPPQVIDTPLHRKLDENLTFNPFHCLREHRPLGVSTGLAST